MVYEGGKLIRAIASMEAILSEPGGTVVDPQSNREYPSPPKIVASKDYSERDKLPLGGLRVSELCGLKWKDLQTRGDSGQVKVKGKGSKSRCVLLPKSLWVELINLQPNAFGNTPVFRSRNSSNQGHLTKERVDQIVTYWDSLLVGSRKF
ncbi:MAG: tyrosine-type recombinase/integrase [Desmonostoc vinosum HA7617-LM4]|nr:tyrosine-type recombinase/integrase [Desmonostoc vinosum HA7617-LM4]